MKTKEALDVLSIIYKATLSYGKNEVGLPGIDSRVLALHPTIVLEGRLGNCLSELEAQGFIAKTAALAYGVTEAGKMALANSTASISR